MLEVCGKAGVGVVDGCKTPLAGKETFYVRPCDNGLTIRNLAGPASQGWVMPRNWDYRCGSEESSHGCGIEECCNVRLCKKCTIEKGYLW